MTDPRHDPKARFSSRVDAYTRCRSGYPRGVMELFRTALGLTPEWSIADVGSGTGISAEPLLRNGNTVYGVEPNREMRDAAERLLGKYAGFRSIAGSGEQTGLPDRSQHLVMCAQAFHWLDKRQAASEFRRIARAGAFAAVMWNRRRTESSPFMREYDRLLVRYGTDYLRVAHEKSPMTNADFAALFGVSFDRAAFENEQRLDLEGLRGRLASTSYTPAAGEPGHAELQAGLEELFARFATGGRVALMYETEVYFARLED